MPLNLWNVEILFFNEQLVTKHAVMINDGSKSVLICILSNINDLLHSNMIRCLFSISFHVLSIMQAVGLLLSKFTGVLTATLGIAKQSMFCLKSLLVLRNFSTARESDNIS